MAATAINPKVVVVSVVLYRARCSDSILASLSSAAPRTWLSTLPDPPDYMHHRHGREEADDKSQGQKGIAAVTNNVSSFTLLVRSFPTLSPLITNIKNPNLFFICKMTVSNSRFQVEGIKGCRDTRTAGLTRCSINNDPVSRIRSRYLMAFSLPELILFHTKKPFQN